MNFAAWSDAERAEHGWYAWRRIRGSYVHSACTMTSLMPRDWKTYQADLAHEKATGRTRHAHSRICMCGQCPSSPPEDGGEVVERRRAREAPAWLVALQKRIPRPRSSWDA